MNNNQSSFARRIKYGGLATVFTVIFIAGVIILNVIATAFSRVYPADVDLTSGGLYTMAPEAAAAVRGASKPVQVYALGTKDGFLDYSGGYYAKKGMIDILPQELVFLSGSPTVKPKTIYLKHLMYVLEELPRINNKITLSYIDMAKNPGFTKDYVGDNLEEGDIIVRCGARYSHLKPEDLFNTSTYDSGDLSYTYIISSKAETALAAAVSSVSGDRHSIVNFLTGHGEEDYQAFSALLSSNGYDVSNVDIGTAGIDPSADFIVIMAPGRDYAAPEIEKLRAFLTNGEKYGKNLMVFFGSGQPALPNLEAFLAEWGISVSKDVIAETNTANYVGNQFTVFNNYKSDLYGKGLSSERLFPVMPFGRALSALWENKSGLTSMTTAALLATSPTASPYPADAGADFDLSAVKKSELTTFMQGEQQKISNNETYSSKVFACASYQFVSAEMLSQSNAANAKYILSVFNTVTGTRSALTLPPKTVETKPFSVTKQQSDIIGTWIFMVAVPLALLIAALAVWLRRRHL